MNFSRWRPISISLSPNVERDDLLLAYKLLFEPWKWKGKGTKSSAVFKIEEEFKNYLKIRYAFSFNSGRSALTSILAAIEVQKGDEVLLQAFTCNAAVNPILYLGARPVFVDIDNTLNLSPEDLEKKITSRTRAVIVQHTFGTPAKIEKIKKICERKKLFLIEDCAHSLGVRYKNKPIGTFGDASFFSFGRDKVISSVYGGMAVTNNTQIGQKLKRFYKKLSLPSYHWILQQILHPIIFSFALPFFSFFNIGKGILYLCQKLKILSPSVYPIEKKGRFPGYFPKRMPEAMAILALNQFKKLERLNRHRKKIATIYNGAFVQMGVRTCAEEESIYMRYPILIENAKEVRRELKKQNILLDDGWHSQVIVPPGTEVENFNYIKGSCPNAERLVHMILNLPTSVNIKEEEAEKIVEKIKKYL